MDALLELIFKGAARFILWVIVEFFFELLCWYVGWGVCRLLSAGRYPKIGIHDVDKASKRTQAAVCIVGLLVMAAVVAAMFFLLT